MPLKKHFQDKFNKNFMSAFNAFKRPKVNEEEISSFKKEYFISNDEISPEITTKSPEYETIRENYISQKYDLVLAYLENLANNTHFELDKDIKNPILEYFETYGLNTSIANYDKYDLKIKRWGYTKKPSLYTLLQDAVRGEKNFSDNDFHEIVSTAVVVGYAMKEVLRKRIGKESDKKKITRTTSSTKLNNKIESSQVPKNFFTPRRTKSVKDLNKQIENLKNDKGNIPSSTK